jgi:ATP-binding cassette subfamily B protein
LKIQKGSCVGFVGATGSGKSTLLDIVMCLLNPTSGSIKVDCTFITKNNRKNWQANISHVPQLIYLADTSIEENIAFGTPKESIDRSRVKKAAEQAGLSHFIANTADGYKSIVGEGGMMLSGGQRQRIGIARALYKQSPVLILDEATSALDEKTEEEIMSEISKLSSDITILIVAHRIKTLKRCDKIIKLDGFGGISETTYNNLITSN